MLKLNQIYQKAVGEIQFIYGFLTIASIVFSVVIFTGRRMIFKYNYFYTLLFIMIVSGPINIALKNPDGDYTYLLVILMIFVPMYICIVLTRKETYLLENVKKEKLINIITKFFEDKDIKYEVEGKEIYLPEHNKTIDVKGNYELYLNLREIKKLSFYEELLGTIKFELKNIEKKIFPLYGCVYLIYAGVLYWMKGWI
ncbi:MAG: hypothetical protein ACRC92_20785 [Peptostreptococcaceae bacterium]